MKAFNIFVCTLIFLALSFNTVLAQDEALQREMRIAESILGEIFTGEVQSPIPISWARTAHVSSEYIPGYGVHLSAGENISSGSIRVSGTVRIERKDGDNETVESRSSSEEIEKKIMEYITQYASTMQSLQEDEVLRISYGLRRATDGSIAIFTGLQEYTMDIPKLSFVVKSEDLRQHREGRISDEQLMDRVEKQDLSELQDIRDFNIFSTVLEASLNSADTEQLRVNRKPAYDYLPGLGVHFHVNISGRSGFNFAPLFDMAREIDGLDFDDVDINIDLGNISSGESREGRFSFRIPDSLGFEFNLDSLNINSEEFQKRMAEVRERSEEMRKRGEEVRSEIEIQMSQQNRADLSADVEKIKSALIETIRDYGSTLSSLQSDELLRITLNWSGRNESLPRQTVVRITKQNLLNGAEPVMEDLSRR